MSITKPESRRERRKYDRVPYRFMVQYQSARQLLTGTVDNLSEGGLRLEVPQGIALDDSVALSLPLYGEGGRVEPCQLAGRVVRRAGPYAAVSFGKLLPKHMLQIRDFVWRAATGTR